MHFSIRTNGKLLPCLVTLFLFTFLQSCTNTEKAITGVATLAVVPSNEIEQIFYLGVFDPQEQVPQTIYRVRIHGQASALNQMKFGSGWVKSDLVDSLTSQQQIVAQANSLKGDGSQVFNEILNTSVQRKLIAFGPEGFRISPKDHRLVVVMGASPDAFFSAVDKVSGQKARMQNTAMSQELVRYLLDNLAEIDALNSGLKIAEKYATEAQQ